VASSNSIGCDRRIRVSNSGPYVVLYVVDGDGRGAAAARALMKCRTNCQSSYVFEPFSRDFDAPQVAAHDASQECFSSPSS